MITGIFIIAISVVLLAYWVRYTCVLLLRNAEERAAMASVPDDRFSISWVLESLKSNGELDPLELALERDYHVVTYLIKHATDLELASIENRLLVLDYRLMRLWSKITRSLAPAQSRRAMSEMASVLNVLVGQMSDRDDLQLEA